MPNIPDEKDNLEAESREKFARIYRSLTIMSIIVGIVSGLCVFNNYNYYASRGIFGLAIGIGIVFAYAALCSHEDAKRLRAGIHDSE